MEADRLESLLFQLFEREVQHIPALRCFEDATVASTFLALASYA